MKQLVTFLGGHPLTTNDAEFMTEGYIEALAALVRSQLVSGSRATLEGVVVTKATNDYTHTAGYIFHNNEIYQVDVLSAPLTDTGTPKFKLDTSYPDNNPVTYETGDNKYVHHIRKLKLVLSTDPDGEFAWNDIKSIKWHRFNKDKDIGDIHHQVGVVGDYFDIMTGLGKPGTKFESTWCLMNGQSGTVDAGGKFLVGYSRTDADYNATNGSKTGGNKYVLIDPAHLPVVSPWTINDPGHGHTLNNGDHVLRDVGSSGGPTSSGNFVAHTLSVAAAVTGINHNVNGGGGQAFDMRSPYVTVMMVQKIA